MADPQPGLPADDIAAHPAAAPLLAAWQSAGPERRAELLAGLRVPGPIALRGRYWHLLDPQAPAGPWNPGWPADRWYAALRLEHAADQAASRNDASGAQAAWTELLEMEAPGEPGLLTVHAKLGLGDLAIAADEPQEAVGQYDAALTLADSLGYRFGRLRALVGLGYAGLAFHSAQAGLARFADAITLARSLGDRAYLSNALLGAAECAERLGELDQAAAQAKEALDGFAAIGATIGAGNAAQRLAAMLHRLGRRDEARHWLEYARDAFTGAANPMGLTNVLSGLGDLLLQEDDFAAAEQAYRQALELAQETGLRRSRAHALQDLGRLAMCRSDWPAAISEFGRSLAAYREIDDLLGVSNALDKLARVHGRLGQPGQLIQCRMDAIFAIEEYRATHRDERSQREYRDRFAAAYAAALEAASEYGSATSFAVVADCLAGRRLAGLVAAAAQAADSRPGTGPLTLLSELLARADQRLVGHRRSDDAEAVPGMAISDRRERVVRWLGAIGIKHGLAPQAQASLDDLLATVYLPPADEGAALLGALPGDCHVLQVLIDPVDHALVHWLWREPDGTFCVGRDQLPAAAADLIATLGGDGEDRIALRLGDLAPLGALLPEGLREALRGGADRRLLLIPVGDLWLVPWSAIPVDDQLTLGEAASYVICPSLTIQRQLATRPAAQESALPRPADLWRSPFVSQHDLAAFLADPAWQVSVLPSPEAARERLRAGSETMVVTGHGRPVPGLGHYLELGAGDWLLPVDLIGSRPPRRLAMIACWGGAVPGRGASDPLSLATLALSAGSAEILATVGELADSVPASRYVERVLAAMAKGPVPAALHEATSWILRDSGIRSEPVFHWAPLVPIGTFR